MATDTTDQESTLKTKIVDFLTLEPHILALFGAVFLITLGEQMWSEFFTLYFETLGGTVIALGVFKSISDTLDAVLQFPGGVISDKWGRLNAGISFVIFGIGGYFIYAIAPSWEFLFFGLVMVQGTSSLLQPTIFAIIGDSIPPEKRTNAFSVQSILKRLPIVVAPMIGGFIFNSIGIFNGVRATLWLTIALGSIAVIILYHVKKMDLEVQNDFHETADESDDTSQDEDNASENETRTTEDPIDTILIEGEDASEASSNWMEKIKLPRLSLIHI